VLHRVDAWVQRLTDPEDKIVAEPVLAIAKQVQGRMYRSAKRER